MKEHIPHILTIISGIGGCIGALTAYIKTQSIAVSGFVIIVTFLICVTIAYTVNNTNKKEIIIAKAEIDRDIKIAEIERDKEIEKTKIISATISNEINKKYEYYDKALEQKKVYDEKPPSTVFNIDNHTDKIIDGFLCLDEKTDNTQETSAQRNKAVEKKSKVININEFKESSKKSEY